MLSADQININFQKAKSDAQALDDLAVQIENLAKNQLDQSINKLSGAWTGANADIFIGKERQVQTDIKSVATDLRKVATDVRATAEEIYRTEMRNYEIAARREAEARAAAQRAAEQAKNSASSIADAVKNISKGVPSPEQEMLENAKKVFNDALGTISNIFGKK